MRIEGSGGPPPMGGYAGGMTRGTLKSVDPVPGPGKKSLARLLFESLDTRGAGSIPRRALTEALERAGILADDPRILETLRGLEQLPDVERIDLETFETVTRPDVFLLQRALQGNLVVPDFPAFTRDIASIYDQVRPLSTGKVADYIPQLRRVDPSLFGVSICTIDGQRHGVGDTGILTTVQSVCKPLLYSMVLEEHGEDMVHRHVGHEPSGRGFNELTLNKEGLPHNPMLNAGAIMCCALIRPKWTMADRFDHMLKTWTRMAGGRQASFNNAVYHSEKATADRNFALGYFMRENRAFPRGTDLIQTLDFYFQNCSVELSVDSLAVVAATLARGGVCPLTGETLFQQETIKDCLSLMYSCGMYDFSGEFAFSIGLPAKSSVSGLILVVVPNVMGLCIWSPRLDQNGNSTRGIAFCQELIQRYSFHNYERLITDKKGKKDPRMAKNESQINGVIALCWAAAQGDLREVQQLVARGVDLDGADYDGRTAMHLAASEGQESIVEYFLRLGARPDPVDRWGGTPLTDAKRHGHAAVAQLLEAVPARRPDC